MRLNLYTDQKPLSSGGFQMRQHLRFAYGYWLTAAHELPVEHRDAFATYVEPAAPRWPLKRTPADGDRPAQEYQAGCLISPNEVTAS